MPGSPLTILIAGMVGAAATAAVTVIGSAIAFGGPDGYVVVQSREPSPPGWEEADRVAPPAPVAEPVPATGPASLPRLVEDVRGRLRDPEYASLILRDEPRALRFLFDSALELGRPDDAWDVLERHGVFAAHLDRGAWVELVTRLEATESNRAAIARAAAEELFGGDALRR